MKMKRKKDPRTERVRTMQRAKARLERERIYAPPEPDVDESEVPVELADLSDADLMEQLREKTAWVNYLSTKLAEAELVEESAEYQLKQAKAVEMLRLEAELPKGTSVTELKARAELSDDVSDAEVEYQAARAYRKLLEPIYESAERKASNISREITRRVGRDGPDRRNMRWNP